MFIGMFHFLFKKKLKVKFFKVEILEKHAVVLIVLFLFVEKISYIY